MVVIDGQDKLQEGSKVDGDRAPNAGRPRHRSRAGSRPAARKAREADRRMSPSRPFILRPVATSLLMAGVLLAGFVAYRQLPVSALPEVDYPTIQVLTFYPGASPEVMASSVTAPLERQFGQVPGLKQMTSTSSFGSSVIMLQFALNLNIDIAEQQVQAAINASRHVSAARPAESADLQQEQSRRRADPDAGADFEDAAAFEGGGFRRHHAGAEDLAAAGRGAGEHQRRAAAGGAHSGESDRAGRLRPEPGRSADSRWRRPTSTRPRATSRTRASRSSSAPTISCMSSARLSRRSSSPIATAARCGSPTSPP